MKKIFFINFLFISWGICFAQQASDYFPEDPGWRWEYKLVPLDSSNTQIDSLTFYKHDLFNNISEYNGKLANIVVTKFGPIETIFFQPYLDSIIFHFDGANGFEHFKVGFIGFFFEALDSALNDPSFSFVELLNSLEKWYSVYRFAQTVYDEYTIFHIDTTVIIGSENVPLRFEYIGVRLPDEMLVTAKGDFECKKFIRKIGVSLLVTIPPLPTFTIPIAFLNDTVWIAPDYWIVKGVIPAINIDLSTVNASIPPFFVPGLITTIDEVTSVKETFEIADRFEILQNYPNPFNPSTTIKFTISDFGFTILKVIDVLGNEVATLVDEYKPTGTYEVEWDASGLPSGIYFYQLQVGSFAETKKMLLLK
jgi:hypothetical protein